MIIQRVGIASCSRIVGTIYAFFGLIVGLCFSLGSLAGLDVGSGAEPTEAYWLRLLFGLGAILALPVLYGLLGLVGGAIGAWVFNNAARTMGGLEIELSERAESPPGNRSEDRV